MSVFLFLFWDLNKMNMHADYKYCERLHKLIGNIPTTPPPSLAWIKLLFEK